MPNDLKQVHVVGPLGCLESDSRVGRRCELDVQVTVGIAVCDTESRIGDAFEFLERGLGVSQLLAE